MLGKGRAQAISDADFSAIAVELVCHPADLEAIAMVESNGFGWFPDGRIKILFEKHQFYKYLPEDKRAEAVSKKLARKNWVRPNKGGYSDQSTPDARYKLLQKAIAINERAAFRAISIGRFQIMGFNHEVCGYPSAKAMFEAFVDSEVYQLRAFVTFLRKNGLVPAIRARSFDKVEEIYNGGGLGGEYARRMREESSKLRAGKWKGWSRDAATGPITQPLPQPASAEETFATPELDEPKQNETTKPQPKAPGMFSLIGALILVALYSFWEWLSALPCDLVGLWC